jgi:ubiquinone biosynthesis monooxygenase Coq7
MKDDEVRHAAAASASGAMELPAPVKALMHLAGRVMTRTAHYI